MAQLQSVKILEVCSSGRLSRPKVYPSRLLWLILVKGATSSLSFCLWTPFCWPTTLFGFHCSKAQTLSISHPLAGNLTWPNGFHKPVLNYIDGDGVSFTVAEFSSVDFFHDLCSNNFREATKCHPLLPNLSVSHNRAAAIALQVTVFPNPGFCVGIASHHAVFDGKLSTSFMQSWAHICKAETKESWSHCRRT